jgi:hypothetical protein
MYTTADSRDTQTPSTDTIFQLLLNWSKYCQYKVWVMYGTGTSLYQTRHSARTPKIMFPGQFVLLSEVLIGWKSVGTNDRSAGKYQNILISNCSMSQQFVIPVLGRYDCQVLFPKKNVWESSRIFTKVEI